MSHLFWKYRFVIVGFIVLISLFLGYYAPRVRPDNSLEALSVENDPSYDLMKRVEREFGSEEFISISYETDDILSSKSLAITEKITQFLEKVDGIEKILSLTNLWKAEGHEINGEETLAIDDLIHPEWIKTGVPAEEKEKILTNPIYKNLIYSPNGKVNAIIAQLTVLGDNDAKRSEIIDQVRGFAKTIEAESNLKIYIFGYPVFHRATFGTIEREQKILTPLMMLAVVLLMFVAYRSVYLSLIPVVLMGVVFLIVIGTLGYFGINLNWLTSVVPAVIMIVSICDTMHVINAYLSNPNNGEKSVRDIFRKVGLPTLITSATTAIGFSAMIVTPIIPVRQFGLYVAYGVVVAYLLTFTIFVILISYSPKKVSQKSHQSVSGFIKWILKKSLWIVENHQKKVLWTSLVIFLVSIYGATQIVSDTDTFGVLKKDPYHLIEANDFIRKGAGGGSECYVFLDGGKPNTFYDPAMLRVVEKFEQGAPSRAPEIVKGLSIVDLIKYFNQAFHNNNPDYYKIPDTREEVANLFLLMEMERDRLQLQMLINDDYSQVRMRFFTVISHSNKRVMELAGITQRFIDETVPPTLKGSFTGRPFITAKAVDYLPSTMRNTIIFSMMVITVLLMILYRSVYVGLIAMIPNFLTILVVMGIMGLFGFYLDTATCMVFSVGLGIATDDTIHLVWSLKQYVEMGFDYKTALKKVFEDVGIPVVTSTIVLIGGFLMLMFANTKPTNMFGLLVAICCAVALVADLLLTTTLFMILKPFKAKQPI